jgi:hypothetical protein
MTLLERTGLENRAPDSPPCDSLAEGVLLSYVLHHAPSKVVECDLLPLLVFPEHRLIWEVMQRAYRPDETHAQFFLRWLNEAERTQPGLSGVLSGVGESWARWPAHRLELDPASYESVSTMDWDWWLARLDRVGTARRLLEKNQRTTEHLWRGDVDGALAVMKEAVHHATADEPGMEIPVA